MKKIIFLLFLLSLCLTGYSQTQSRTITGSVFDDATKEAIELASIRVLNLKDSAYVTGTATNDKGKFSVAVKPGRYLVHVSFMGYVDRYFSVSGANMSIGEVFLKENSIVLGEAVVTAKAIEVQVKGDTIEYNADSYKVQQSAVVEDLLKKMPGAEVDADGKITINGKEVKKILVDGKEFFGNDPKVASKNLPAAMVDKLQVLDKKSDMAQMTGFDDGEEETVINLTVKKGMKQGLYGSSTAGMGSHDRYGLSGIANYMRDESQFTLMAGSNNTNNEGFTDNIGNSFRGMGRRMSFGGRNGISKSTSGGFNFALSASDKLKWGGNIRYGDTDNDVEQKSFSRKYLTNPTKGDSYENKLNYGNNKSTNFNGNFRFEFTPDSLTKIIFSPNMQYGENRNYQTSNYLTTYLDPSDTINSGNSRYFSEGNSKSFSGTLDVSRQLNNKGRVLSFSFSGGLDDLKNDGTNWSKTTFHEKDSVSLIDQVFDQKNKGYNWRAYISYVEPLGRNNFLQLSYNVRKNYSEQDRNTFLNDGSGSYTIVDSTASRKLENDFMNQEIGINFKSVREKYNYTIGGAFQPSSSDSWTITPKNRSQVKKNVLNFAPVAQFNYLWSKRHNLRLDYNGTTNQPSASQLSDVRDESDPLNISYGNPDLKPSFTNRLRVRYQRFNPERGSVFMIFGGGGFVLNDIVQKTINKKGGITENTYANVNGNWNASLRMVMNQPLKNKKFSFSSMSFVSYQDSKGFVNESENMTSSYVLWQNAGIQFRSDMVDFGIRGNIRYTNTSNSLSKNLDREISDFGGNFSTTLRLPYDFVVESDLFYSGNAGSSQGFKQNEWLWNAALSKQLFKAKNGTIKVNVYDILKQKSNISQSSSPRAYTETITNTLNSYVMVSFSYRFQVFKGGAKRPDADGMMPTGRGFGHGGRHGGPMM